MKHSEKGEIRKKAVCGMKCSEKGEIRKKAVSVK